MLMDLFSQRNFISINLKLIKLFGINAAVYLTELCTIMEKATAKSKLIENKYFKLDRKFIVNKLALSMEDQLLIDSSLMAINLLQKQVDNPDNIYIDTNLLINLIAEDNIKLIDDLSKKLQVKSLRSSKESQRQQLKNNLKNNIKCSNYELLTALRNWVDSIYAKPNGFLSQTAITKFQNTLNNYTQGDLDLALRLVEIASIQGYKDCQWAIEVYERDQKFKAAKKLGSVRVTTQEKASEDKLSDIVF